MNDVLLPWTTRGVRYKCRDYLSSTLYTEASPVINADDRLRADLPLAKALPMLKEKKSEQCLTARQRNMDASALTGSSWSPLCGGGDKSRTVFII